MQISCNKKKNECNSYDDDYSCSERGHGKKAAKNINMKIHLHIE